jgi:hypothetical protein
VQKACQTQKKYQKISAQKYKYSQHFSLKMRRKIKQKFSNYTFVGSKYRNEFRKQIRSIIVFTLGFTIAFAWRETIFDWAKSFTEWITHSPGEASSAGASIFITILCVLLIILTSYWLKDKNHPY